MYFTTGSFSRTLPCSRSFITAPVVANTFVSEARSNIVSAVIASRFGRIERDPYALRHTIRPRDPTSKTPPGISSFAMDCSITESTSATRESLTTPDLAVAGLALCLASTALDAKQMKAAIIATVSIASIVFDFRIAGILAKLPVRNQFTSSPRVQRARVVAPQSVCYIQMSCARELQSKLRANDSQP